MAVLSPTSAGTYVDATLGGGGHTLALLEAGAKRVVALDMDGEALAYAGQNLARFVERLSLHISNFRDIEEILDKEGLDEVQGVLFDLGLSWHQVRSQERGFSYQGKGPLDMRFDSASASPTALDIIRSWTPDEIERILVEYGEEPRARSIAKAIVEHRRKIETTRDLRDVLQQIVAPQRLRKTCMRVFQALRIAVNDEIENLKTGLDGAISHLAHGGKVAVISYHSLEDRIVKNVFREMENDGRYKRTSKKPAYPSAEEIASNPAARSARLRALERL